MTLYEGAAANPNPPKAKCSWCGRLLRREHDGYWWTCPTFGHPSSHDTRRVGLRWRVVGLLSSLPRFPNVNDGARPPR